MSKITENDLERVDEPCKSCSIYAVAEEKTRKYIVIKKRQN